MASPLPGILHNARLTFSRSTYEANADPLGPPKRSVSSVFEVTAFLKEDQRPKHIVLSGVDSNSIYVRGYAVKPQNLPEDIRNQTECLCEVWRGGKTVLKGKLRLSPAITPTRIVDTVLGDKINGLLMLEGGGVFDGL